MLKYDRSFKETISINLIYTGPPLIALDAACKYDGGPSPVWNISQSCKPRNEIIKEFIAFANICGPCELGNVGLYNIKTVRKLRNKNNQRNKLTQKSSEPRTTGICFLQFSKFECSSSSIQSEVG